jgi:uncharacterized protein
MGIGTPIIVQIEGGLNMEASKGRVLITGATRGLGWEFADILAARGFGLFLTGRDGARLRRFKDEHPGAEVTTAVADLSEPGGAEALLEAARADGRPIDHLVNNAGFGDRLAFADCDLAKQRAMIQVNIDSLVALTHGLLPAMLERGSGAILNVASTAAFVPGPFMSIYYASKAFVLSFSMALAEELRGSGVTVSALCPGPTETDFDVTAGTTGSRLVRSGQMEARVVAEAGVRGMLAGRRMIVPGFSNKLVPVLARLAPRKAVARAAATRNSDLAKLPAAGKGG